MTRAKRSLGQNFLVDPTAIGRILDAAGVRPGETVVEIGPGRGALTGGLRLRGDRLILIEKDDDLAAAHRERFEGDPGVAVLNADALTVMPDELPFPPPYRVVANLPYNVGGRITMHLLEDFGASVAGATLMFQKEVADRICASPSTRPYGALSVLVQSMAEAWSLFGVPPGAFRPIPKVQSRVVRLRPRTEPLWAGMDYEWFRAVVRGAFVARRKTLVNSLGQAPGVPSDPAVLRSAIAAVGLREGIRGDAVSVEQFVALAEALKTR
jgi:16S rRNA (adenine1518-N6/adenine1519-N6)-dimethyltransferase